MKIVLAFGVFDLLHPGHEWFLREAAKLGDRIVVVIARDKNTEANKGRKPVWDEETRRKSVEALSYVDEAWLGHKDWSKHLDILDEINPDIVVRGYDQSAEIPKGPWKVVQLGAFEPDKYKTSLLREKG